MVSVGNKDGGGGVGDVGEIRRADKALEDGAEVVNVCRVDGKRSRVCDGAEPPVGKEDEG